MAVSQRRSNTVTCTTISKTKNREHKNWKHNRAKILTGLGGFHNTESVLTEVKICDFQTAFSYVARRAAVIDLDLIDSFIPPNPSEPSMLHGSF